MLSTFFFKQRIYKPRIDLDIQEVPNRARKMTDNKSKHNSKSNLWKNFCALEKFFIPRGRDSRQGEVVKNRHLVELFDWRANVRLKVFFCLLDGKRERENFVAFIEFGKKALSDLLGLNYIYVEFCDNTLAFSGFPTPAFACRTVTRNFIRRPVKPPSSS